MTLARLDLLLATLMGSVLGVTMTSVGEAMLAIEARSTFARIDQAAVLVGPTLDAEKLGRLLGLAAASTPAPVLARAAGFRLRGTLTPALACVEPLDTGHARSVVPGEELDGATVREVGHGYLLLDRGGTLERVGMLDMPGAGLRAPAPSPAGATVVEVPRAQLDEARRNFTRLASQVRVVPAFEAGEAVGFRVAWLAPDALALQLGLRAGDVVTHVNGHRLTDGEALLALAGELRGATSFVAEVRRGGQTLKLGVRAH